MLTLWPLLLPIAAASGWFFGRGGNSETDEPHYTKLSKQYYVGLNYLLNEQPDKAVDVFIKLLEVDSDTVETHLALGSLFRRRGEVDRAIRIHQNLIARPQLSQQQRVEALMALGRDYMSAGVFDRAERIFAEVSEIGAEQTASSLQYLLNIYQQEKAWEQAIAIVRKLEVTTGERMHKVIAHHYCELVGEAMKQKNVEQGKYYLKKALATDKDSVRASLLLGQIEASEGRYKSAIKAYKRVRFQDPDFLSESIPPLVLCYERLGNAKECKDYLYETLQEYPRISIILILAKHIGQTDSVEAAADFVAEQLSRHPSIRGLNTLIQWHIDTTYGKVRDKLQMLRTVTSKLLENKPIYRCGTCGFGSKTLHWYCPGCKQWSAIKPIHGLEGD